MSLDDLLGGGWGWSFVNFSKSSTTLLRASESSWWFNACSLTGDDVWKSTGADVGVCGKSLSLA